MVTVYRPDFDEQGSHFPVANDLEVGQKAPEVGVKMQELSVEMQKLSVEMQKLGVEMQELGVVIDFDRLLAANRKNFRNTCKKVWQLLAVNLDLSQLGIASNLKLPASSVQSVCNAWKEIGLLKEKAFERMDDGLSEEFQAEEITNEA